MTAADRVIRCSTAGAVVGVAAVTAVASYEHAYALIRAHGQAGWTGRLAPLTVDGLIYASSMVMLDSARRKVPVLPLARWLPGLGNAATLVAHGLGHGPSGAVVRRIFAEYLAGRGLKAIAEGLTRDDIPSPSACDPERNKHRCGIAWS